MGCESVCTELKPAACLRLWSIAISEKRPKTEKPWLLNFLLWMHAMLWIAFPKGVKTEEWKNQAFCIFMRKPACPLIWPAFIQKRVMFMIWLFIWKVDFSELKSNVNVNFQQEPTCKDSDKEHYNRMLGN